MTIVLRLEIFGILGQGQRQERNCSGRVLRGAHAHEPWRWRMLVLSRWLAGWQELRAHATHTPWFLDLWTWNWAC